MLGLHHPFASPGERQLYHAESDHGGKLDKTIRHAKTMLRSEIAKKKGLFYQSQITN